MLSKSHPTSRYEIITKIASGGMATVYLGALKGPYGFENLVAIKRLHAHLLDEPSVRESLLMEARSASRIRHVNVVDVRDIEVFDNAVQLVMTYVEGTSVGSLIVDATRNRMKIPPGVAIRIILDACAGLHAAHELTDRNGKPLELVHRDVSPQNLLVGIDGITRITDFGVARDESSHRLRTNNGALKGKFAYMAPEYIAGRRPDRRVDVFALAVVLWEALTGRRLFKGSNDGETISRVTDLQAPRIGYLVPELGDEIDSIFEMALSKDPDARFSTTQAFGMALETVALNANVMATAAEVGQYVREHAHDELARLNELRLAAGRYNKTHEIEPYTQGVPTEPAQEVTAHVKRHPSLIERDPDATPLSSHQGQLASIIGDDFYGPRSNGSPSMLLREITPTLQTRGGEHVQEAAPSVAVVSAPALRNDDVTRDAIPGRRWGRFGTTPIPNIRDLLFRQDSPSNAPAEQPHTQRDAASSSKDSEPPFSVLVTLPVPIRADSLPVLPFNQNKHISQKPSRLRWVLAACLVFLGFGVVIVFAPEVRGVISSSDAKK